MLCVLVCARAARAYVCGCVDYCGADVCVWCGRLRVVRCGYVCGGGGGGNEGLKWAGAAQCVRVHVHAVWRVRISDERNVR